MNNETNILYLSNEVIPDDFVEQFKSGKISEVFIDTTGFESLEKVALLAVKIRNILECVPGVFEPVVAGPITKIHGESAIIFARHIIRVTPMTYTDYVIDLENDKEYE